MQARTAPVSIPRASDYAPSDACRIYAPRSVTYLPYVSAMVRGDVWVSARLAVSLFGRVTSTAIEAKRIILDHIAVRGLHDDACETLKVA